MKNVYKNYIKRILDIICATSALVVFGWLYITLAILVRLKLGSPIIFSQERGGKIDPKTGEEKVFKLYKFRSMTNECDADGNLLPDKKRLTKFGKILRSTSLDELPEAWNILIGDMSVVGPRPLLTKYLGQYNEHDRQRHLVRPGLTGLAQVNGRNGATWEEKFGYDVDYVNSVTFIEDVKIVFLTVKKVLKREGINFEKNHQSAMNYFETHSDSKK